jgi:16S rRNA (guanine966-N2)-methyltransferase
MRVVAGTAGGRRLQAPPGRDIRPTSDRVREAIFSSLESMDALHDARVVDLFAGTGALGIEALSRGAAQATFVDDNAGAIQIVKANLAATGLTDRATVTRADVLRWLASAPPADLALVDPPYAFDGWSALLQALPAPLAVLESDRDIDVGPEFEVLRQKHYGSTVVTTIQRSSRA